MTLNISLHEYAATGPLKINWHLDVAFREDYCRVRTKNGAENLPILRKFAIEMLKKQSNKISLKRRPKKSIPNLDPLTNVFKESKISSANPE